MFETFAPVKGVLATRSTNEQKSIVILPSSFHYENILMFIPYLIQIKWGERSG